VFSTEQLIKTAEEKLGQKILSSNRIASGEVNQTYKLDTLTKPYILRYKDFDFSWATDPEFVSKSLSKLSIPQAKTIYFENNPDKNYCIEIQEFIDREAADIAIHNNRLPKVDYYQKLGKILRKIHSVQTNRFGHINTNEKFYIDVDSYWRSEFEDRVKDINKLQEKVKLDTTEISDKFSKLISSLDIDLFPVLIHSDATPDNAIYTKEKQLILIDWDGAIGDCWMRDFAWLTFFSDYNDDHYEISPTQKLLTDSFFEGYGRIDIEHNEFLELQKAYHLALSVNLLDYYLGKGNKKWSEKCMSRTKTLLT